MINRRWFSTVIMALVLVGCATIKGDWKRAVELNTVETYKEFLQKHPKSDFTAGAKIQIQNLEWQKTRQIDTIESYELFLYKYPQGEFIREAEARIEELNWQDNVNKNRIEGYQKFLKQYPKSKFSKQAHEKIEVLEWQKAKSANSYEAYMDFLKKYSSGKLANEAKMEIATIEELEWHKLINANTIEDYYKFLEKYPKSKFASLAKERIQKLEESNEWPKVEFADTGEAYRQFLIQFPQGEHEMQAKKQIKWFQMMDKIISDCENKGSMQRFAIKGIEPIGDIKGRVRIKDGEVQSGIRISMSMNLVDRYGQVNPNFQTFTVITYPFARGTLFQFEGKSQLYSNEDFSDVFSDKGMKDGAICVGNPNCTIEQKAKLIKKLKGYRFFGDGDETNRLTLGVCKRVGLVHVFGKGRVKLPNGKVLKLGY